MTIADYAKEFLLATNDTEFIAVMYRLSKSKDEEVVSSYRIKDSILEEVEKLTGTSFDLKASKPFYPINDRNEFVTPENISKLNEATAFKLAWDVAITIWNQTYKPEMYVKKKSPILDTLVKHLKEYKQIQGIYKGAEQDTGWEIGNITLEAKDYIKADRKEYPTPQGYVPIDFTSFDTVYETFYKHVKTAEQLIKAASEIYDHHYEEFLNDPSQNYARGLTAYLNTRDKLLSVLLNKALVAYTYIKGNPQYLSNSILDLSQGLNEWLEQIKLRDVYKGAEQETGWDIGNIVEANRPKRLPNLLKIDIGNIHVDQIGNEVVDKIKTLPSGEEFLKYFYATVVEEMVNIGNVERSIAVYVDASITNAVEDDSLPTFENEQRATNQITSYISDEYRNFYKNFIKPVKDVYKGAEQETGWDISNITEGIERPAVSIKQYVKKVTEEIPSIVQGVANASTFEEATDWVKKFYAVTSVLKIRSQSYYTRYDNAVIDEIVKQFGPYKSVSSFTDPSSPADMVASILYSYLQYMQLSAYDNKFITRRDANQKLANAKSSFEKFADYKKTKSIYKGAEQETGWDIGNIMQEAVVTEPGKESVDTAKKLLAVTNFEEFNTIVKNIVDTRYNKLMYVPWTYYITSVFRNIGTLYANKTNVSVPASVENDLNGSTFRVGNSEESIEKDPTKPLRAALQHQLWFLGSSRRTGDDRVIDRYGVDAKKYFNAWLNYKNVKDTYKGAEQETGWDIGNIISENNDPVSVNDAVLPYAKAFAEANTFEEFLEVNEKLKKSRWVKLYKPYLLDVHFFLISSLKLSLEPPSITLPGLYKLDKKYEDLANAIKSIKQAEYVMIVNNDKVKAKKIADEHYKQAKAYFNDWVTNRQIRDTYKGAEKETGWDIGNILPESQKVYREFTPELLKEMEETALQIANKLYNSKDLKTFLNTVHEMIDKEVNFSNILIKREDIPQYEKAFADQFNWRNKLNGGDVIRYLINVKNLSGLAGLKQQHNYDFFNTPETEIDFLQKAINTTRLFYNKEGVVSKKLADDIFQCVEQAFNKWQEIKNVKDVYKGAEKDTGWDVSNITEARIRRFVKNKETVELIKACGDAPDLQTCLKLAQKLKSYPPDNFNLELLHDLTREVFEHINDYAPGKDVYKHEPWEFLYEILYAVLHSNDKGTSLYSDTPIEIAAKKNWDKWQEAYSKFKEVKNTYKGAEQETGWDIGNIMEASNVKYRHYSAYDYDKFAKDCLTSKTFEEFKKIALIFSHGENNIAADLMHFASSLVEKSIKNYLETTSVPEEYKRDAHQMVIAMLDYFDVKYRERVMRIKYPHAPEVYEINAKKHWDRWNEYLQTKNVYKGAEQETGWELGNIMETTKDELAAAKLYVDKVTKEIPALVDDFINTRSFDEFLQVFKKYYEVVSELSSNKDDRYGRFTNQVEYWKYKESIIAEFEKRLGPSYNKTNPRPITNTLDVFREPKGATDGLGTALIHYETYLNYKKTGGSSSFPISQQDLDLWLNTAKKGYEVFLKDYAAIKDVYKKSKQDTGWDLGNIIEAKKTVSGPPKLKAELYDQLVKDVLDCDTLECFLDTIEAFLDKNFPGYYYELSGNEFMAAVERNIVVKTLPVSPGPYPFPGNTLFFGIFFSALKYAAQVRRRRKNSSENSPSLMVPNIEKTWEDWWAYYKPIWMKAKPTRDVYKGAEQETGWDIGNIIPETSQSFAMMSLEDCVEMVRAAYECTSYEELLNVIRKRKNNKFIGLARQDEAIMIVSKEKNIKGDTLMGRGGTETIPRLLKGVLEQAIFYIEGEEEEGRVSEVQHEWVVRSWNEFWEAYGPLKAYKDAEKSTGWDIGNIIPENKTQHNLTKMIDFDEKIGRQIVKVLLTFPYGKDFIEKFIEDETRMVQPDYQSWNDWVAWEFEQWISNSVDAHRQDFSSDLIEARKAVADFIQREYEGYVNTRETKDTYKGAEKDTGWEIGNIMEAKTERVYQKFDKLVENLLKCETLEKFAETIKSSSALSYILSKGGNVNYYALFLNAAYKNSTLVAVKNAEQGASNTVNRLYYATTHIIEYLVQEWRHQDNPDNTGAPQQEKWDNEIKLSWEKWQDSYQSVLDVLHSRDTYKGAEKDTGWEIGNIMEARTNKSLLPLFSKLIEDVLAADTFEEYFNTVNNSPVIGIINAKEAQRAQSGESFDYPLFVQNAINKNTTLTSLEPDWHPGKGVVSGTLKSALYHMICVAIQFINVNQLFQTITNKKIQADQKREFNRVKNFWKYWLPFRNGPYKDFIQAKDVYKKAEKDTGWDIGNIMEVITK